MVAASRESLLEIPRTLVQEIARPFIGREEEAKVIVLSFLTREHSILIGEPGTAKSALVRRASSLVRARFFKYLLTKYTEPSELFGPLDIVALQRGEYRRITRGKLPEAEIAFLDEIFNANSAILNMLLTLLQERVVYDGYTEVRVPLWTLIAASNRVPEDPELEALYDRFVIRHKVGPIPEDKWEELLGASWEIERQDVVEAKPIASLDELAKLYNLIFDVDMSDVRGKLLKLIAVLEEKGLHMTDRRKGKALKVIAAHAVLNGRLHVTEEDLMALKYVAPSDMEDFERVNIILSEELKTPERIMRELSEIHVNVKDIANLVKEMKNYDPRLIEMYRNLKLTRSRVLSMYNEVDDDNIRNYIRELSNEIDELLDKIAIKLGM